jgi:amino acid adenylation domain-containing protein
VAESSKTESSFQPPNGRDVTTSLTDKETQKLLLEKNHGGRDHTWEKCIHKLFEAQAERTPETVALSFKEQHLTYRELNERANQLAHHLQKLGVGSETLVGLFLERSLEMVVGLLAILKAGGAYVPMDPKYPRERLTFMLKDAHSPVVVTQKLLEGDLSDGNAKVICLDSDWLEISCEPTTNPVSDTQPHHLAYVIYTSGSTGTPKGSLISHCNVVRLFQETQVWFNFTQSDVWTLFHSCAFDFSVWELWGALFNGGRLVIVPFSVSRTPEDFHRLLCEEGVTVLNQTPSAFRQLIQVDEVKGPSPSLALRLIIFGGEALDFGSLKPWFERHGDQKPRLVNMYGITETTVHVTYRPIDAADLFGGSMIGIPIPDLQVYLLDEQGHSVPFGVPGEICVGGAGVGRGYLNRPELTAEKFIADPFSSKPGARLYKTGDLARYLPDGNLEFLGRIDQQVKIRGFRIELGEIEAVLNGHPAVRESVVIAREDVPGEKILAAYLVVRQEPAPTATELREFLLKKLPDYMVPAAFVKLEKLPLTPNGKIDRKALPGTDENRLGLGVQFVAPATPTEVALAKIWCELLGVNQIGIHENYFELGGHSLMAMRLVSEIKRQMKLDLPVRTVFQHPTIQEMAKVLPNQKTNRGRPELIQLQSDNSGPELFFLIDEGSLGLFKLAHFLGKDLRLYASVVPLPEVTLKASKEKQSSALPRMEDLAAEHVALIKSRQTTGPVVLAGHCFGGVLAFEVAHQLQDAGIPVAAVLFLDTWMADPPFWWQKKAWLQEHLGKLLQLGPLYLWRKSRRRIKLETKELASRLELAIRDDFNVQVPLAIRTRIYVHAMNGYRPKVLATRGILFVSQDDWLSNAYRSLDDSLGSSKLFSDGMEVINVPGNHVTLLDEMHLPELARLVSKSLEQLR